MVDIFLFETLALARLRQRLRSEGDGMLLLSKDRRSQTRLTRAEAEVLTGQATARIGPSARLTQRCCYLAIPFSIAVCDILWNAPALGKPLDVLDAIIHPMASVFLITCGMPLAMLLRHCLVVAWTMDAIDAQVAPRTWFPAPPLLRRRGLDAIELVGVVIAASGLVPAMLRWIVELGMRGAPPVSPLGPVVLLALLARRWWSDSRWVLPVEDVAPGTATDEQETAAPARRQFGRSKVTPIGD